VLLRVYAKCLDDGQDPINSRIAAAAGSAGDSMSEAISSRVYPTPSRRPPPRFTASGCIRRVAPDKVLAR
jgi:hypothetical protein